MNIKTKVLMKITENKNLAVFVAIVAVAIIAAWL
jgi:hypothetical protein